MKLSKFSLKLTLDAEIDTIVFSLLSLYSKHLIRYSWHFFEEYVLKEEDEKPEDENISNILLWAIFANRKELAEICWLRVENHLCKFYKIVKWKIAQCSYSDNQYLPHFNYFYYCIANIMAYSTNYNVKQFIGLFYNCFCQMETQKCNVKTHVLVKQILTYCSDSNKNGNFVWHLFFLSDRTSLLRYFEKAFHKSQQRQRTDLIERPRGTLKVKTFKYN